MSTDPRSLQWGKGGRITVSDQIGNPIVAEGDDGDIQLRHTQIGAKLFSKLGGKWFSTPLSNDDNFRIGTTISDHLSIDQDSVDIWRNDLKVAKFSRDTIITGGTVTLRSSANNNDKFILTANSAKLYDNNVQVASFGANTVIQGGTVTIQNTTNNNDKVILAEDSLTIYDNNNEVASFGANTILEGGTITIRNTTNNNDKIILAEDSLTVYDNNNEVASFGANTTITGGTITIRGTAGTTGHDRLVLGSASIAAYANNAKVLDITDGKISIGPAANAGATNGAVIGNIHLASGGAFIYGAATDDYVNVKSDGVDIYTANQLQAAFGATTTIGDTSNEHVSISSSGVLLKDGATELAKLVGTTTTLGYHATTKVVIDGSAGTLAVGSKFNIDSSGVVTVADVLLTGKIVITSTGTSNVCIGTGNVDSGTSNISVGVNAGAAITSASTSNICIGTSAGNSLTGAGDADNNIAIGSEALHDSTGTDIPDQVVSIGPQSSKYLIHARYNVAIGYRAMAATSYESGGANEGGTAKANYNVAIGVGSMSNCHVLAGGGISWPSGNVAVGHQTLQSVDGDDNVCIGVQAGNGYSTANNITTGYKNICIGHTTDVAVSTQSNGICIGTGIQAAGNHFSFGKPSNVVTNEFTADASWSYSSDIRKKTNIQNDTLGLSFIEDLRPVTFNWKPSTELPEEWESWTIDTKTNEKVYNEINTTATMHGLIAQEVKSALDTAGISTFGGWKESEKGEQSLSREMFVLPLIKAVQELSAQVNTMQAEINNLK